MSWPLKCICDCAVDLANTTRISVSTSYLAALLPAWLVGWLAWPLGSDLVNYATAASVAATARCMWPASDLADLAPIFARIALGRHRSMPAPRQQHLHTLSPLQPSLQLP